MTSARDEQGPQAGAAEDGAGGVRDGQPDNGVEQPGGAVAPDGRPAEQADPDPPSASTVMPSGKPSAGAISANERRPEIAPLSESKSNTSTRWVVLSMKYMRSPAGLQARPFEIVVCDRTRSSSPPASSRYRDAVPGIRCFDIVPAQRRPRGSHLQSLKRLAPRCCSTLARTRVPSSSSSRMWCPAARSQPPWAVRGSTALTSPSCSRHHVELSPGLQPWTLPREISTRSSSARRSSQNAPSPSWSRASRATTTRLLTIRQL